MVLTVFQTLSQVSTGGTTIKEAETVRVPNLPKIQQLEEWQFAVREAFGNASGRPAKANAFLCVAEQPGITLEDLQDSGDFESIDCKLATALQQILTSELRYEVKLLRKTEHAAGRMLKRSPDLLAHSSIIRRCRRRRRLTRIREVATPTHEG